MAQVVRHFWHDDSGATTVDWVVLTAAIVGIGVAVLVPIAFSVNSMADRAGDHIAAAPVGTESDE